MNREKFRPENAAFSPKVGLRHRPDVAHDILQFRSSYSVVRQQGSARSFTVRTKNLVPLSSKLKEVSALRPSIESPNVLACPDDFDNILITEFKGGI